MTPTPEPAAQKTRNPHIRPWTCPFCLLLCDADAVELDAASGRLQMTGTGCACGRRALERFGSEPSAVTPKVDGQDCSLNDAIAAAAKVLRASRQPLFSGLGTDVAGARALYRLACATGAICDAAGSEGLMQALRVQQDRGGYFTTLAEVRTRADLIVCIGALPLAQAPNFFERCGVDEAQALVAERHVVLLGGDTADATALSTLGGRQGVTVEAVALEGDLFSTVSMLAAMAAGKSMRGAPSGLARLVRQLQQARYAVLVGEPGRLGPHGGLIIEAVNRIVGQLNQKTRAAGMWLGGGNGAGTVNQVFAWLSGLPLRSRAGPLGLEHEPLCFGSERLLNDAAVDSLLWVSSFDPDSAPPPSTLPTIVLGHPDLAAHGQVFIPVSTPGIGSGGHLFRADGVVMLPLFPVYEDTLPTLADVLQRISAELQA